MGYKKTEWRRHAANCVRVGMCAASAMVISITACAAPPGESAALDTQQTKTAEEGAALVETVNGNVPDFGSGMEHTFHGTGAVYGELDGYGRATGVTAYLSADMLREKSEKVSGDVATSGYHAVWYDTIWKTDGTYGASLWRRCHLLKSILGGSRDDARNFFTGTYDLNHLGMAEYEQMVIRYLKETDNHVLYQITPSYTEDHLIADGVYMQARSVEDGGAGICFSVYIRNVQPGIHIDYAAGLSYLERTDGGGLPQEQEEMETTE